MYAIVEIAGQQFKVAKDQKVFVNRLSGEEGDSISFDKSSSYRRRRQHNTWRPGYRWCSCRSKNHPSS